MIAYSDLKDFFSNQGFKLLMAADAEPIVHERKNKELVMKIPAGGVSIALEPIIRASGGTYIARGRTIADKEVLDKSGKLIIDRAGESYSLKRIFISEEDLDNYYNGFANQTLWPLCHVAFEPPQFNRVWFEGYRKVNQKFAESIKQEIKGKTLIWIHDYQLSLVPKYLAKPKNTIVSFFWHIPWPTWEVFRILPNKKEILESLLTCDFLAFHRGYQARNFLETVEREFAVRIDDETNRVYFNGHVTTVKNLPLGIDTDVIESLIEENREDALIAKVVRDVIGIPQDAENEKKKFALAEFFEKNKVILGIDRLDYTKGLRIRLRALERFFERNPEYIGQVVYLGILAPSREKIPSYIQLKKDIRDLAEAINKKYQRKNWKPVHLINEVFARKDIINFYNKANVCLVTPLDDGMNLVSKEFVIASSFADDPGMLVLSQFAGSAIDLDKAVIINPYNINEVADGIKRSLEMNKRDRISKIKQMAAKVRERNIYAWTEEFIRSSLAAVR